MINNVILGGFLLFSSVMTCERVFGAEIPVVPEHPRLFLRQADLADLRKRCQENPTLREAYGRMREFAYGDSMQSNLWVAPDELSTVLVVYLVENRDPKLLERARRYLAAFKRQEGDSWTQPRMLKALAHAYDWLHGELSPEERQQCADRMSALVSRMRTRYRHSDYNNHVYLEYGPIVYAGLALAQDGIADDFARKALDESAGLIKKHFIPTINQLAGDTGGGWHESMSYWSFFAYELAHQLEAWRTATGEDLFKTCTGLRGAASWLLHCTRPHDDSMAPIGDINTPYQWGWQETAYLPLLAARYRDGIAQQASTRAPRRYASRLWPLIIWHDPTVEITPLETLPTGRLFPGVGWAAMRSSWKKDAVWGLFICGDYYAGHQHADQNSFVIAHRGDLAVDAGEYGAKGTAFHNTVLIGGAQRPYGNDPRRVFAPIAPGSEFDTGDIVAYQEHRHFSYVVGDASNAYGNYEKGERQEKAPLFIRRFLFLKPATFIIDDHFLINSAEQGIRWLLHSREAPEIKGRHIRLASGDGELLCESLLPAQVSIESKPQQGGRKQRTDYRIDVTPQGELWEMRFLHVLHARQRGDSDDMATTSMKKREGIVELTISANDLTYDVHLSRTHLDANTLAIARADGTKILERRLLPAGVLPYGREGVRLLERWDGAYRRDGRAPWDTGRPATELTKAVENDTLKPGRAVVLGCGTGTNAIYLARNGFEVTGIDIAPTALGLAAEKARRSKVKVQWLLSDVLKVPDIGTFDVIFDRGCYHGVRRVNAAGYRETVRQLSHPGALFLLLAGNASEPPPHYGPPRVKESELRAELSPVFEFERLRTFRFDTTEPESNGALGWSALLKRK